MIAVIADDISGAAELANAALEAGLSAEVQLRFCAESEADVICVDTASRSLSPMDASAQVAEAAEAIAAARPEMIYKKCDSVLRGSVATECLAIAREFGKKRVLLVPANPSRKRIIREGQYYVDGTLLAKTAFANDPEHPRATSDVAELLGPAPGIEIPDVATASDLLERANQLTDDVLPAGGVDFFSTLLRLKRPGKTRPPDTLWRMAGPTLFVCGSHAAWMSERGKQCTRKNIPILPMSRVLMEQDWREDVLSRWASSVGTRLRERGAVMITIGGEKPAIGVTSEMLTERLAHAVDMALQGAPAARVFLEGGATASAVIRKLGLERFNAHTSPGLGTGTLSPVRRNRPVFLIKPGSYAWPEAVWTTVT